MRGQSPALEQAHVSAAEAASAAGVSVPDKPPSPESERQELQAELTYLRTFSDVCRTHQRAYLESLGRSVEEWEQAERRAAIATRGLVTGAEKRSNADFTAA